MCGENEEYHVMDICKQSSYSSSRRKDVLRQDSTRLVNSIDKERWISTALWSTMVYNYYMMY